MNSQEQCFASVRKILANLPASWVELTTHRLDIYNESLAKSEFLQALLRLMQQSQCSAQDLENLPTAYDYIRLGHQLSSILEWVVATINQLPNEQIISFTSNTMPILAVVRYNSLQGHLSHIYYNSDSTPLLDLERLKAVYGYNIELHPVSHLGEVVTRHEGMCIFVTESDYQLAIAGSENVDVTVNLFDDCGATAIVHKQDAHELVKEIQHVRRRESIAMSPANCVNLLQAIVNNELISPETVVAGAKATVNDCIKLNTGSNVEPLVASSGLSIQYAMMMGLVEDALTAHPGKTIEVIIPPNCYGGTNDQARRISDMNERVVIVDLPVDGGNDMVTSLQTLLDAAARNDVVPLVLAEIPTNPRVEVPDLTALGEVLSLPRKTAAGENAIAPVFMADQTFCPNVKLLSNDSPLAQVKVISYSSGSKFPSGGRCIAGYCAANDKAAQLQGYIAKHLTLTDNGATPNQWNTLAKHMPSMPERIAKAYDNTKALVAAIHALLPEMKINFVSDELAAQSFTPSVFSMDLPTQGDTPEARENYKRTLNQKLIDHMLAKHPDECKYCVSYGQLKGSYWTIPATSTQGTTKESDKDYIIRVALSPVSDAQALADSFAEFCRNEGLI